MRRYSVAEPRSVPPLPRGLSRRKPRDFFEWRTLRAWGKLPEWEEMPPGYLLREAREKVGLTQQELAARLGISQQSVSQAERWDANPTVSLMRRWAEACGAELEIRLEVV